MNGENKKHNSLENLRIVAEIMFRHSIATKEEIYNELKEKNKLSEITVYRKLEKLKDEGFIDKKIGSPNIYKLNPLISQLILELKKRERTNIPNLANKLECKESELISNIKTLKFYNLISGEISIEDTIIYFVSKNDKISNGNKSVYDIVSFF